MDISLVPLNIIYFKNPDSYVVRTDKRGGVKKDRSWNKEGPSDEDKRFRRHYVVAFIGAYRGSLPVCEAVIESGFRDFHAYSLGKFRDEKGSLDNMSLMEVAQMRGHQHIVRLFQRTLNGS